MKTPSPAKRFPPKIPDQGEMRASLKEHFLQLYWHSLTELLYSIKYVRWLQQRQRSRLQLLDLNDDQLRDIGLTRQQAQQEGQKAFWQ